MSTVHSMEEASKDIFDRKETNKLRQIRFPLNFQIKYVITHYDLMR